MARSFNVLYRFLAKDSFTGVSEKIKKSNKKLGNSFGKLDTKVKTSGKVFKGTSQSFIGGFKGMASAALAFFSIKGFFDVGGKFQASLADLSAITGATGDDLDKLKNKTLEMAKASVTSQADVAEAIKLVASAKPELLDNIDALTATTDAVLLLKNAAGIELADAANITAQGLNIFGEGADQASRFVNVLAAGAKLGASEIADTGAALLIAGPGARAAGLSFEQLNAAIQTVAKGGIKGTQAGTALNAIFGRLRRSGRDFKELGLEGAFKSVALELDAIVDPTARAIAEAKIFGEEHSKVGLALLTNAKLLTQYESSLAGTNIAQEQADIRLGSFNSKLSKLGIVVKDTVIKTFLRLEPLISKQITLFTDFLGTIDPKQVEAFADSLGLLVDAAVMIGKGFKIVLSVLKGVGKVIGEIAAAIATLDLSGLAETFSFKGLKERFSIGDKLFGVFGDDKPPIVKQEVIQAKVLANVVVDSFNVIPFPVIKQEVIQTGALATNVQQSKQDLNLVVPRTDTGVPIGQNEKSVTDINVNMTAPPGVVQSVQSVTQGRAANVGLNLREE